MPEPLISTGEVARRLGVTPGAVGRWVRDGWLVPAVTTPGGRHRFLWTDVQRQQHERAKREQEKREQRKREAAERARQEQPEEDDPGNE